MGKGGGKPPPEIEPVIKKVNDKPGQAETASLLRRRGLEATKKTRNALGGGMNMGGRK